MQLFTLLLATLFVGQTCLQRPTVAEGVDIDAELAKLSQDRKCGQMNQLTIEASFDSGRVQMNLGKIRDQFSRFGFGSFYNTPFGDPIGGVYGWDCAQWLGAVRTIQSTVDAAQGVPVLMGLDSVRGVNYVLGATLFPHNIGLGATFNPQLVELTCAESHGYITGKDSRTCGIPWTFSPAMDIGVQPLWARHYETFSDDPYLVAIMAHAVVKGMQSPYPYDEEMRNVSQMAVTAKHWLGYSWPASGADRSPANIPDWILERYFYPPWASAVRGNDAGSVMLNSGSLNGVPGHADQKTIEGVLRTQMRFSGFTLSDYQDVLKLQTVHHVASSYPEAAKMAVNAGLDMSMVPFDLTFAQHVCTAVNEGGISRDRLNAAVRRILKTKQSVGLWDRPVGYPDRAYLVGNSADREVARKSIEEGVTMLKNENNLLPLPLNGAGKKILVTGPHANSLVLQSGGWTIHWRQALNDDEFRGKGATFFQGIQAVGQPLGYSVQYILGSGIDGQAGNFQDAINAARNADYTIIAVGEKPYVEFTYDIGDLTLNGPMLNYIDTISNAAKNTILIMVQGRPRLFAHRLNKVGAVLYAYLPGPEAGIPMANLIFGKASPSGRLPFSYPSANGQLAFQVGQYAHKPQWDFGFGLSYTSFEYSNLQLADNEFNYQEGAVFRVSVTVANTGQMSGKEVVMLWLSEELGPSKQKQFMLRRFQKVHIATGSAMTVSFDLHDQDFRYVLRSPGPIQIKVGTLAGEFELVVPSVVQFFSLAVPETFAPWASLPIPDPSAAPVDDTPIEVPPPEEPPAEEPVVDPPGQIPITPFDPRPLGPLGPLGPVAEEPSFDIPPPQAEPFNFPPPTQALSATERVEANWTVPTLAAVATVALALWAHLRL